MSLIEFIIYTSFALVFSLLPALFLRSKATTRNQIKVKAHSQFNYVGLSCVLIVMVYAFLDIILQPPIIIGFKNIVAFVVLLPVLFFLTVYYYKRNVRAK